MLREDGIAFESFAGVDLRGEGVEFEEFGAEVTTLAKGDKM